MAMSDALRVLAGGPAPEGLGVREMDRILALPRRAPIDCVKRQTPTGKVYVPATEALIDIVTGRFSLKRDRCDCLEKFGKPCLKRLNAMQAWALWELPQATGMLGFCSVGSGKSIAGVLAPMAMPDCKTAVLFGVPTQREHYEEFYQRLSEHFLVPSMVFDSGSAGRIIKGRPVLHFIPYSRLSDPSSTLLLESIDPDFIIADEAHCLADKESVRTGRFLRYLADRMERATKGQGRRVRLAAWSGTLINKSIEDNSHLALHALGLNSPIPIDPDEVKKWAEVLDPVRQPDRSTDTAVAIYKAFGGISLTASDAISIFSKPEKVVRDGFKKRISETVGVIMTRGSNVDASLYFHERTVPKMPEIVKEALKRLREEWVRPDDVEIEKDDVLSQVECIRDVARGFYYKWEFPRGEDAVLIANWRLARTLWFKEVREKCRELIPHVDSPHLCERAAMRGWDASYDPEAPGALPAWKAASWPMWRDIRDLVQPVPVVVWLDDWFAADAAAWAKQHRGIVWSDALEFGQRVAEIGGIPWHGGGPNAEKLIRAEKGNRSIVASVASHGESRDGLQHIFSKQYLTNISPSAKAVEQLLGRCHRDGQKADTVETWVALHFREAKDTLRRLKQNAEFVDTMTLNENKLLLADFGFDL